MAVVFWTMVFTAIVGTVVSDSDIFMMTHRTPQYFQANMTITIAKQYIQHNLPYDNISNITAANRGFGVLFGVIGKLVQAYIVNPSQSDPQAVIEDNASYARQNYGEVARATKEILEDASKKITPILELLNKICTPSSYFDCNGKMEDRVQSDLFSLRLPARLFTHLGKLSKNTMRNRILIEKLVNNNEVVSYLKQHVRDPSIDKLIRKMAKTYVIMMMMGTISM